MFGSQVEHMSLTRYIEMLKSAEFRDDLDIVNTVHTPKGKGPCSFLRVMFHVVALSTKYQYNSFDV